VTALLPFATFALFIGAAYFMIGRRITRAQGMAVGLVILAAFPLIDGGLLAVREYGRLEHGLVAPGVVTGKLSTMGEDGTRTIGGSWRRRRVSSPGPWLRTADGFRLHDILARLIVTGSSDAWFVEYRTQCGRPGGCYEREEVSRALWKELGVGRAVNIRTAKEQDDDGRLDANPMWPTAFAKLGIGFTLFLAAAALSGRWTKRRRKYVTASAIVTSVEPAAAGGPAHWRVGFAYLTADGVRYESADVVYVPGVKPGDDCLAVYPPDRPDLGTLRVTTRTAA
jgi:hypothetical protein